jgi:hypothetical protein
MAALHQLCDLATNKVRKKLAIYEDLTQICVWSVHTVVSLMPVNTKCIYR